MGKSYAHPLVVLIVLPNENEELRFGFAAGRSIGGAVQRNRAKRLMRAAIQSLLHRISSGWDLLFLARQPIQKASFQDVQAATTGLLERARLLKELVEERNA